MRIPLILLALSGASSAMANPPELIPRDVLFGNPAKMNLTISPDGTHMGFLAPSEEGVMNIWIQDMATGEERMVTDNRHSGIYNYQWAHNNRHLLYVQDKEGDENWHLYATDLETGESRDLTPFPKVAAQDLMLSPSQPDFAVIALNKPDPTKFDMYRIDLRTGEMTLEVENPGDIQHWVADSDLRVRAAWGLDAENSDTILRVRDSVEAPWRDLVRWSFEETGSVLYTKILGFTPDGTKLFVQSPKGTRMTHIALMDAKTGEELEVLAHDEQSDVANFWLPDYFWKPVLLFSKDGSTLQAVLFDFLIPEWRILDESVRVDFETLSAVTEGVFTIEDRDAADNLWVVNFISDKHPDRTYLYDRTTKSATLVFDSNPRVADFELASMEPVVIPARDGLKLPSYLTLPLGVEPRNLPLVLHPHGGPWARDVWAYNPYVQHLANRGYAVLQVNFRGSTGYGKDHLNASTGEWGIGAMQHDLTDAVQWAVEQGIADPDRVCIYGASYGGYASLAGAAFTPELYTAAISLVGPSHVGTLFDSFPPSWSVRMLRWKLRIGIEGGDDPFIKEISPLFHADRITAPLLVGHGANDPRVKLSESEQIVESLQHRGMPVDFVVYPDEGHGFNRPENTLDWAGRVETFLAGHLGGRQEPFKGVEGSSAVVRVESP